MSSNALQQPISVLSGVGPSLQAKLEKLGIDSVQDLLFHLPRQYQDRSKATNIAQLKPNQFAVVDAYVVNTRIQFGKRRSLLCTIDDDSAVLTIRLFHFSRAQQNCLSKGRHIRCFGEVRLGPFGAEMVHPEYQLDPSAMPEDDKLTPIYPSTQSLSQKQWQKLQTQALVFLQQSESPLSLIDLPADNPLSKCSFNEALLFLHQPPSDTNLYELEEGTHPSQQRLAFEELLAHQISMLHIRAKKQQQQAPVLLNDQLANDIIKKLPFTLTNAQQRTIATINQDLQKSLPMLRLVQGDVGSGKTIVAAIAAAKAVAEGYQVAIMAPTEILAEQHQQSFSEWFSPFNISVTLLLGKHTKSQKEKLGQTIAEGEAQIVIGTHALFQDSVSFDKLGLVIIDEQHRFGVHQRLALRQKGADNSQLPHQLIMTATPIPRTLAMTAYADLDVSVIDELPPNRKSIQTIALSQDKRDSIIERIAEHCATGQQAYWVCTLIEESEALNCQAAEEAAKQLQQELANLKVGLIHGRLKATEKSQIMDDFVQKKIDLLVATTVIEVGVNVPNATIMVIENPERLGLAQLHQLRGRIGRGDEQSYCVLLYQLPLSQQAKSRIAIMRQTNDGFIIAEEDLKLRGPGEILGSRQTGAMLFRIADIERDADLLPLVRQTAQELINNQSDTKQLVNRWITRAEQYSQA